MRCGCIVNRLFDFNLEPVGCRVLRYQDLSTWVNGPGYEKPATYDIIISVNGGGRNVTVKTEGITELKNEDLGFSGDLPNALITVKIASCEDDYYRYRIVACKLDCCIDQYIYQLIERNARDSDYEEIERVQRLLDFAKRNAEDKNIDAAKKLLEEAEDAMKELNCNCKCK